MKRADRDFGGLGRLGIACVLVVSALAWSGAAVSAHHRFNDRVTISGTPATSDTSGTLYSFTPSATDSSGRTLTFSISNKPSWAAFNSATGKLSGSPSTSNVGTFQNIVISARDSTGAAASLAAFSIAVTATAAAPPPSSGSATVSWTAPTMNTDGSALTDLAGYYVKYGTSPSSLTGSAQVSGAGATRYTVTNLSSGTWYFAVASYTSSGTQSTASQVATATVQ
jgi:hypothetical protein